MAKYNVIYKEKAKPTNSCRGGYTVDASSESEAIAKWKQTIAGKSGLNEVVDVYITGTR